MRLILVLYIFVISNYSLAQSNYDPICWTGIHCLKVGDFQGEDSPYSIICNLEMDRPSAMTSTILDYKKMKFDTLNCYHLVGYFERKLSWIDKEGTLLSHEQTHFNIQQLIIRRTNKELDSLFRNGIKINFDTLVKKTYFQLDSLQSTFDKETYHGLISLKNREWVKRIAANVSRLDKYAIECD